MNIVIDDAAEVYVKDAKPRREVGTYIAKFLLACEDTNRATLQAESS